MKPTPAQMKAVKKYQDKAYDRVSLRVPKGELERLQGIADNAGMSLNKWLQEAIKEKENRL
jgi:predicted HicB family RNase H-like nuclease